MTSDHNDEKREGAQAAAGEPSPDLKVRDVVFAHAASFALDPAGEGLTVLPGQTGAGKTYAAAAIACAVATGDPSPLLGGAVPIDARGGRFLPERLIYVTPLVKNRDAFIKEISKVAANAGIDPVKVMEKVYRVDSVVDSAIENIPRSLSRDGGDDWPDGLRGSKECRAFCARQEELSALRQEIKLESPRRPRFKIAADKVLGDAEGDVREAERDLRKVARAYVRDQYRQWCENLPSEEEQPSIESFVASPSFDWLRHSWPAVETFEKSVFVMTPEKFLMAHDTLIEPPFVWADADSGMLEGAMLLLDESDTTYGRVLNKLVSDAVDSYLDPVDFVQKLAHLAESGFVMRDRAVTKDGMAKSFQYFCETAQEAQKLCGEYDLDSNFKLVGGLEKRNVQLFSDGVSSAVKVDGEFKALSCVHDGHWGKNMVVLEQSGPASPRLSTVLRRCRGVMLASLRSMLYLSQAFQSSQSAVQKLTLRNAISSVLAELHVADADRIAPVVAIMQAVAQEGRVFEREDLSLYSKGLSVIDCVDGPDKCTLTTFEDMELLATPEAMLCNWADCCKVVLMSATALIPQVHNFHLPYIRDSIKRVYELPEDLEGAMLRANAAEKELEEGRVCVRTEVYSIADPLDNAGWSGLGFGVDVEFCDKYQAVYKDLPPFVAEREWKIVAFVADCLKMGVRSALIFNTAGAQEGKNTFDLDRIRGLCQPLFKQDAFERGGEEDLAADVIVSLGGSSWEEGFEKVKRDLSAGKRRYVVLSYNTAGQGFNPQYRIGKADAGRVCALPGKKPGPDKDFEAVYLGKPTNIVSAGFEEADLSDPGERKKAFLKGLWEQSVFYERGEQTFFETDWRRSALASAYTRRGRAFLSIDGEGVYDLPSVRGEVTKIVNQAVGRIARTSMKAEVVLIGMDAGLQGLIEGSLTAGQPTSLEYDAVVAAAGAAPQGGEGASSEDRRFAVAAENVNRAAVEVQYRQALRRSEDWKPAEIERRRELWDAYLRWPTATEDEFAALPAIIRRQGYIKLPRPADRCWFEVAGDAESWKSCRFAFGEENPFGAGGKLACEGMTLLPELMRSGTVRRYFDKKGYATRWEKKDYMIPAAMIRNAYMGALGEAAARAWLEAFLGLKEGDGFCDMPGGLFEMFDIFLPGYGEDVFIDVKNWHRATSTEPGYVDHVLGKLSDCGGGRAVLVRACGSDDGGAGLRFVPGGEGLVLEIPYLFDEETGMPNARAASELASFLSSLGEEG